MQSELPPFRRVKRRYAASIIQSALSGPRGSALLKLQEYEDGHFRVIFSASHFQVAAGRELPSKSQWNSFKKRLKRRDRTIFIFRKYGELDCAGAGITRRGETCLYLDFAFLPHWADPGAVTV